MIHSDARSALFVAEAMSVTTGQPVRVPAPRQQYADDARTMTTVTTTMTTVNQTADTLARKTQTRSLNNVACACSGGSAANYSLPGG